MLKETGSTEQISSEIKALRRQVVELRAIKQRCRQAEAALKSFEERNRLLADNAPLGIFTADTQGGVTGISRKMLEMLPWASVDDPKSMNLSDCQAMIESGILADIQRCMIKKNRSSPNIPPRPPGVPGPFCATISVLYLEAMARSAVLWPLLKTILI